MDVDTLYNQLIDLGLFTQEELELVTCLCGYSVETLNDALFVRYGYRSLDQMLEEEEAE